MSNQNEKRFAGARGYALAEELRNEAADVATEYRAELMLRAAEEIERLIVEIRGKSHSGALNSRGKES